jgi:hypothetical protein
LLNRYLAKMNSFKNLKRLTARLTNGHKKSGNALSSLTKKNRNFKLPIRKLIKEKKHSKENN